MIYCAERAGERESESVSVKHISSKCIIFHGSNVSAFFPYGRAIRIKQIFQMKKRIEKRAGLLFQNEFHIFDVILYELLTNQCRILKWLKPNFSKIESFDTVLKMPAVVFCIKIDETQIKTNQLRI